MSTDGSSSSGVPPSLDAVMFLAEMKAMQIDGFISFSFIFCQRGYQPAAEVFSNFGSGGHVLKISSLEEKVKGKSATILKWNLFIF